MQHKVYQNFLDTLEKDYPKTWSHRAEFKIRPQLISPFVLEIPEAVFNQVESFREAFYEALQDPEFLGALPSPNPWDQAPENESTLTCLDFHYSSNDGLKLIEINTNASLLLPFQLHRKVQETSELPLCQKDRFTQDFISSYQKIFTGVPEHLIILDNDPKSEGLYFEFLMNKEFFQDKGMSVSIQSLDDYNRQLNPKSLVYNRTTDFYFRQDNSKTLLKNYIDRIQCVTPNPRGYFFMADKKRLSPLRKVLQRLSPENALRIPDSHSFMDFESLDQLWSQRKKYFFKPQSSFGGKGAFRGKSISRKMFDSLPVEDYMAQELVPAEKRSFEFEGEEFLLKYDLRFYVSSLGLIDAGARLYQGQTTNMQTDFGGLASIVAT